MLPGLTLKGSLRAPLRRFFGCQKEVTYGIFCLGNLNSKRTRLAPILPKDWNTSPNTDYRVWRYR